MAFLLWALAAWSGAFWVLRLAAPVSSAPSVPPAIQAPEPVEPQAVARLLGAAAPGSQASAAPRSDRLALAGVAAGLSGSGSALIAVDGSAARPYRVGMRVGEALWLLQVRPRQAHLGPSPQGPATLTLELPAPALLDVPRPP